jgi:1-acyl-sn-glycerol-3-phosphate acyltransferase
MNLIKKNIDNNIVNLVYEILYKKNNCNIIELIQIILNTVNVNVTKFLTEIMHNMDLIKTYIDSSIVNLVDKILYKKYNFNVVDFILIILSTVNIHINKNEIVHNMICINKNYIKKVVYYGLEELPTKSGYIIICNHSSCLDYGIIKNICNCYCIIGNILSSFPDLCDKYQYILYTKNDNGSSVKKQILKLISSGNNILIFPEGQIPKNKHSLLKFKKGLFYLAYDNKIPIVPIFQKHHNFNDFTYFYKQVIDYFFDIPINNLDVDVTINKTINPSDFGSFEEFYDYIFNLYKNKISEK